MDRLLYGPDALWTSLAPKLSRAIRWRDLPKLSIELLIDKVYELKDRALDFAMKRLIVYIRKALDLLKSWVKRMADKPYIKMAWELAQDANENNPLNHCCYFAPLETLEWLISGQEISRLTVRERLGKPNGFNGAGGKTEMRCVFWTWSCFGRPRGHDRSFPWPGAEWV